MKLKELAEKVGQSVPVVLNFQKTYGLPGGKEYSDGYAVLLGKLVHLSACDVPQKNLTLLLSRERKLLELLKVDSLYSSPLWFEDLCEDKFGPRRLLLCGYDLGHVLNPSAVQTGLDFTARSKELFGCKEMGDNALRALQNCIETQNAVLTRLHQTVPVLTKALKWARRTVRPQGI